MRRLIVALSGGALPSALLFFGTTAPARPAMAGLLPSPPPSTSDGSADPPRPPPYQPPPAGQAALPPEPERVAMEGQQAWLASSSGGLDRRDGGDARGGGGRGRPLHVADHVHRPGADHAAVRLDGRGRRAVQRGVHTGTPVYSAEAGWRAPSRRHRGMATTS